MSLSSIGFQYSLAQQTVKVNYLGTQFELQPSDLKLTMSVADWRWAEKDLGTGTLNLVLRTTIMVYADTPFTRLSSQYDPQSQQVIFKIASQVSLSSFVLSPRVDNSLLPSFHRILR